MQGCSWYPTESGASAHHLIYTPHPHDWVCETARSVLLQAWLSHIGVEP